MIEEGRDPSHIIFPFIYLFSLETNGDSVLARGLFYFAIFVPRAKRKTGQKKTLSTAGFEEVKENEYDVASEGSRPLLFLPFLAFLALAFWRLAPFSLAQRKSEGKK